MLRLVLVNQSLIFFVFNSGRFPDTSFH